MARPRAFDETLVRQQAKAIFASQGYNGTSIDDLVQTTGLLRGSLYKAFGSKRNLFEALLSDLVKSFEPSQENLDFLTVALKDLAHEDAGVRRLCSQLIGKSEEDFADLLGANLLAKMKGN